MKFGNLSIIILSVIFSAATHATLAPADSVFGRYVGTLKYEKRNVEQLAKIDFIVSRSSENQLEMKAVITLHLGDFKSGEYISYHFDNVIFDLLGGTLTFDQAKEGVTIKSSRFVDGELVAELHSNAIGKVGVLNMKLNGVAKPKLPLVEPVAGEYKTKCNGKTSLLQLHTMRSIEDSSRVGNPFGSYDIRGQLGHYGMDSCLPGRVCMWSAVMGGAYNFFLAKLDIVGNLGAWSCTTDELGFSCNNGCRFERVSSERKSRVFAPPQAQIAFPSTPGGTMGAVEGTYQGFLHHEFLDRFQPTELSIVTYQSVENGERKLRLSASARIFFDTGTPLEEAIAYRFLPRDFPNPLVFSPFTLDRLQDDVDAFLKVTMMNDGVIRGEWYSLLFGRVGTFEVRRADAGKVTLPSNPKMLASISKGYDESWWKLNLQSFQARTPPNSENPYFPLDIAGTIALKSDVLQRNERITGGSYDFYTGKIGLKWSTDGWVIGNRLDDKHMSLITISNIFGSVMQDYSKPKIFRVVE